MSLAEGQVLAESRMRDTCQITVPSGVVGAIDPNTWLEAPTAGAVVYTGPCRLRMAGAVSSSATRDAAGDRVVTSAPTLSIPVSAVRVPVGAVAVITGAPTDDPARHLRLGLRLRVVSQTIGTDMTAQRMQVEVVTG